jgi:hypothetical protein
METIFGIFVGEILLGSIVAFEGVKRRIGYWKGLMWCVLLSPFIGLFIILNSGRLDAKGCIHCGNEYNEAEFCGLCKKNEDGLTREQVQSRLNL